MVVVPHLSVTALPLPDIIWHCYRSLWGKKRERNQFSMARDTISRTYSNQQVAVLHKTSSPPEELQLRIETPPVMFLTWTAVTIHPPGRQDKKTSHLNFICCLTNPPLFTFILIFHVHPPPLFSHPLPRLIIPPLSPSLPLCLVLPLRSFG